MKRTAQRKQYRLRLVIDEVPEEPDNVGYDVDNAQPWPLGYYDTQREAMAVRNAMVMIDPPSSGDPQQDKILLDGEQIKRVFRAPCFQP